MHFTGSLVRPVSFRRVSAMSAFAESGHSNATKTTSMTGRYRPRLCENPPNIEDDGTAPHIGYKGISDEILISHISIE